MDLSLKANDSVDDEELFAGEQGDDGDWEQVGPKNKSVVTRMVSALPTPTKKIFFSFCSSTSPPVTYRSFQKKLKYQT